MPRAFFQLPDTCIYMNRYKVHAIRTSDKILRIPLHTLEFPPAAISRFPRRLSLQSLSLSLFLRRRIPGARSKMQISARVPLYLCTRRRRRSNCFHRTEGLVMPPPRNLSSTSLSRGVNEQLLYTVPSLCIHIAVTLAEFPHLYILLSRRRLL